jgi:hypothetical protein
MIRTNNPKEAFMKKASLALTILLAICLSVPALAADIEGTYAAAGSNPGGKGQYKGNVIISKTGETYKVVWSVGAAYVGTGIVVGDVLSVAYADENKQWFGIVAYRIKSGGKVLEGLWSGHNGRNLGTETLTKK